MAEFGLLFALLAARSLEGLLIALGAVALPASVRIVYEESAHRRRTIRESTAAAGLAREAQQLLARSLPLRSLRPYDFGYRATTLLHLDGAVSERQLGSTLDPAVEGHNLARSLGLLADWFSGAAAPYLPDAATHARDRVRVILDALNRASDVTSTLTMLVGSVRWSESEGKPRPERADELIEESWRLLAQWIAAAAAGGRDLMQSA